MKITIGIPCYKQEEYLRDTLESVVAQTYEDIEVIVVDDGSPDNSAQIAKEYGFKVIQQVNKGLASARNTMIMNMIGDYLLPLDSDDYLDPTCVEKIVQVAKETNADVISPSLHCFGRGEQDVILMPNPTLEDFKEGNRLSYCSAIKKEALLEVGGYSPRMQEGWEDLHLWYDLLTRGKKIVTIQEPLVYYRTKESSMWLDAEKHKEKLWAQIIKDFPQVASHQK
jgi:glycosyltransferase involved in cell wall biosynthesis